VATPEVIECVVSPLDLHTVDAGTTSTVVDTVVSPEVHLLSVYSEDASCKCLCIRALPTLEVSE